MVNKFCYKCGNSMPTNKICDKCKAPAIDMPISEHDQKIIHEIQKSYEENPPSKAKGCLAVLIIGFLMFGLPAIFTFTEITYDSLAAKLMMMALFLLINFGIFKYKGSLSFKAKKYYNMQYRDKVSFSSKEQKCRKCNQLLLDGMIFCPRCGDIVGEDIPIDVNLKSKSQVSRTINQNSLQICTKCGADVKNSRYCAECGTKVEV